MQSNLIRRFELRFQHWVVIAALLLAAGLMGAFLTAVLNKSA